MQFDWSSGAQVALLSIAAPIQGNTVSTALWPVVRLAPP